MSDLKEKQYNMYIHEKNLCKESKYVAEMVVNHSHHSPRPN